MTINSILCKDKHECFFCGRTDETIVPHHCIHGRGFRKLAEEYHLVIPVCFDHHNLIHSSSDAGIELNHWCEEFAQRMAMKVYEWDLKKWISIFGQSFLRGETK